MTGFSWLHLVVGLIGVGWPCVDLRAADLPGKPGTTIPADATSGMVLAPPFASRIESTIAEAAAKGATELPLELQAETRTFRFDATSGSWKPTGEKTSTTLEINTLLAKDFRLRYHPVVSMWFPSEEQTWI
jgi:hypothetical protein